MKEKSLEDLFLDLLRDIYYAERRILKALPKMARGARSPTLREAFGKHAGQTEVQIERLQQVFDLLGQPARGKTCPAIEGIIEEGEEVLDAFKGMEAIDAGLIASAQAVEHYEISRYATLCRWADLLGQKQAAGLLKETLAEEEATDIDLTRISESCNKTALKSAA